MRPSILIPPQPLQEYCAKRKIAEPRLLGSALLDDFRPDSDLNLLVTFTPEADWHGYQAVLIA